MQGGRTRTPRRDRRPMWPVRTRDSRRSPPSSSPTPSRRGTAEREPWPSRGPRGSARDRRRLPRQPSAAADGVFVPTWTTDPPLLLDLSPRYAARATPPDRSTRSGPRQAASARTGSVNRGAQTRCNDLDKNTHPPHPCYAAHIQGDMPPRVTAIQIGNQMGSTEKTVVNSQDGRGCSGALARTRKTVWITQTGLRKPVAQFGSCWEGHR